MDSRPVDPRDTTWEVDHPVFRVTFFDLLPGSPVDPQLGVATDEWEIQNAEISDVLDWAEGKASDKRMWTVHLLVDDSRRGHGMVRLCGTDPNRSAAVDFTMSVPEEGRG